MPVRTVDLRAARRGDALIGCLVALGVVLLILAIGVVFVLMSWRGWTASMINAGTAEILKQAEIPEAEKTEMLAHVEDYAAAFEAGDVGFEQFQQAMMGLESSPLLVVGTVYTLEQRFLNPSTLTDEEKQAGRVALHRVGRGIHEGLIRRDALKDIAGPLGFIDGAGNFQLNAAGSVNDDMLRQVLAAATAKADEAGVPPEDTLVDLSDELKRILDASRTPAAGTAP